MDVVDVGVVDDVDMQAEVGDAADDSPSASNDEDVDVQRFELLEVTRVKIWGDVRYVELVTKLVDNKRFAHGATEDRKWERIRMTQADGSGTDTKIRSPHIKRLFKGLTERRDAEFTRLLSEAGGTPTKWGAADKHRFTNKTCKSRIPTLPDMISVNLGGGSIRVLLTRPKSALWVELSDRSLAAMAMYVGEVMSGA